MFLVLLDNLSLWYLHTMAVCDIWLGNRSSSCRYNSPHSHMPCFTASTESPPEQHQSNQQYNQCNLWTELIGWMSTAKPAPKQRWGKNRTSCTQHPHKALWWRLRECQPWLCPQPRVTLSVPVLPFNPAPPCALPCNHPGSHSLLFTAQLCCPSQERAGRWMWQTLLPWHPTGKGPERQRDTQSADQWLYAESFFPDEEGQSASGSWLTEEDLWIQGDVSDALGHSPPGPSWAAEVCVNSSMSVNSICFLGVNKTQADVPNIY